MLLDLEMLMPGILFYPSCRFNCKCFFLRLDTADASTFPIILATLLGGPYNSFVITITILELLTTVRFIFISFDFLMTVSYDAIYWKRIETRCFL